MKIAFVVNDLATEKPYYTTTTLARQATGMGHEAVVLGVGGFSYQSDGSIHAAAHGVTGKNHRSSERYLEALQSDEAARQVNLSEFDAVMLRADPADEVQWANHGAVAFGELLAAQGVLVVNDPGTLAGAMSKAYFQQFPEVVRPRTLISRDEQEISAFVDEMGGRAVLKPLQGSGGSGVFLVNQKESPNLNQIVEAITRDGYVVAQEFLTAAKDGDVRMFLMNGRPLEVDGKIAALHRVSAGADIRSNMSAGGTAKAAVITDAMLELVDVVRPKIVADGLFLVGLDIVGDKLMEINVFSPGGLGSAAEFAGVNYGVAILEDLEHKVAMRGHYPQLTNEVLACA